MLVWPLPKAISNQQFGYFLAYWKASTPGFRPQTPKDDGPSQTSPLFPAALHSYCDENAGSPFLPSSHQRTLELPNYPPSEDSASPAAQAPGNQALKSTGLDSTSRLPHMHSNPLKTHSFIYVFNVVNGQLNELRFVIFMVNLKSRSCWLILLVDSKTERNCRPCRDSNRHLMLNYSWPEQKKLDFLAQRPGDQRKQSHTPAQSSPQCPPTSNWKGPLGTLVQLVKVPGAQPQRGAEFSAAETTGRDASLHHSALFQSFGKPSGE